MPLCFGAFIIKKGGQLKGFSSLQGSTNDPIMIMNVDHSFPVIWCGHIEGYPCENIVQQISEILWLKEEIIHTFKDPFGAKNPMLRVRRDQSV